MSRMQMLQKTANNSRNGEHIEKEENCNSTNPEPDYNIEMSEKTGGKTDWAVLGTLFSKGK